MSNLTIVEQLHPLIAEAVRQLADKFAKCGIYDHERINRLIMTSPSIGTKLTALGLRGEKKKAVLRTIAAAIIEEQESIPDTPQEDEPLLTPDYMGIIHMHARALLCHMNDEQYRREVERNLYDELMTKALADTGCSAEATSRALTGVGILEHVCADLLESRVVYGEPDATLH